MNSKTREKIEQAISALTDLTTKPEYTDLVDEIKTAINYLNHINDYRRAVIKPQEEIKATDDSLFNYVSCGNGVAISGFNGFDEKEIVIPNTFEGKPVTRILEGAFKDCAFIESVVLGKNIAIIENSAFRSCHNLKSVKASESLTFIGYNAFFECIKLSNIILSDAVTFIGEGAFERTAIESFSVPKRLHFLSCGVFDGCEELKSVTFHDQLLTIGKDCFTNCKKLQHVIVPPSVRFIGDGAFVNCFALKEIEIHSRDTVIGKNVFSEICIYQPDLRYNIRTYYQPLKNICVKCLAGSPAQKYCRENNLRMAQLTNPSSTIPCNVSMDRLLAVKLSTSKKEMVEIYKQRAFQAGLVMEISTSFILATEIIVYLVNHTDYTEEKVKQILGHAENRSMFDEAITIKRISDHDIRPAWESV